MKIARGLTLDIDYVAGGTFALLAKKGAGKTYTARVMAEEFWDAGVPFVFLDPMGAAWGLRSSADGKAGGVPVAIFGGDHADAPLERTAGALMADLVVDEGLSMVLDLSALGSRAAERQFALDFLERLYRRNSDLVHLLIDEADLFAPQSPQAGDRPLLGVTENIVRRGRNRGIGVTLITQRPAVLNKDVLTQVDGLVAMRITGLTDRKAIDEWVKGHGDDDQAAQVKSTLSGLANGESWWWVPELGILDRVQVRKARTFDSSPTKKRGEKRRDPKGFADVDLGAIEAKMAETIERAKASDPRELQKRIRDLERQLTEQQHAAPATVEVKVAVPYVPDEVIALVDRVEKATEAFDAIAADAQTLAAELRDRNEGTSEHPDLPPRRAARKPPAPAAAPRRGPTTMAASEIASERDALPPARRRVLDALAWFSTIGIPAPSRAALAPLAGSKATSGGFKNNLGALRTHGLIDYPEPNKVALTADGERLAVQPAIAPTSEALQDAVMATLPPARRRILQVLIDHYPNALSREDLATEVGVPHTSGGFKNNLGALRTQEVIDYPQQGYVQAADLLFVNAC